jgi:transcriptional regulator with XRE-family HTH domain
MDEKDVTIEELKAAGDPYYFFWVGLNRLYKEFGGTQVQFANRIGLAQSYVSRVLAGTKVLKRATIPRVCKSLGMSFDAIAAEGGAGACDLPPASGASQRNKLIHLMGKRPTIDEDAPPKSSMTVAEMFPDPPYLQFIASGESSWYLSGKAPVLFDPNWAMSIGASGNLAVFRVEDDFMEPVASAGDFALVDLSATRPAHDKVYVLFLKGGQLPVPGPI